MIINTSNYYVYIYYDPRNNQKIPIYVGKGKNKRIYDHLKLGKKINIILKEKIQHIRQEGLEPIVEKVYENISNEVAIKLEKELIAKYGKICNKSGTLCNFTDGGEGISGYKRGPLSEKTKELLRIQRIGKTHSEKTKEKLRKINTGKKMSPESIEKTRQSHIGKKRSQQTCVNIGKSKMGFKFSKESILKIRMNSKTKQEILQFDLNNQFIKRWASMSECYRNTGFNVSNISICCSGKQKTAYGYIWKYVN